MYNMLMEIVYNVWRKYFINNKNVIKCTKYVYQQQKSLSYKTQKFF